MTQHSDKLFAVFLGGKAPKSNTELHDVVFVVGETIEATYEQLMDKWFGTPEGLHLDSWIELSIIDGHRIRLTRDKQTSEKKLFFINLGAYLPGQFTEVHANTFVVAKDEREVKSRAKSELLKGFHSVHTDDLYEVDDCLEISDVDGFSVALEPTEERQAWEPNNGYQIVPKPVVQEYMQRKGIPSLKEAV